MIELVLVESSYAWLCGFRSVYQLCSAVRGDVSSVLLTYRYAPGMALALALLPGGLSHGHLCVITAPSPLSMFELQCTLSISCYELRGNYMLF